MPQPQFSVERAALVIAIALFASFLLLQWWMWTAQFSWSSDEWLTSIPTVIVVAGVAASIALAFRLWSRR